MLLPNIWPLIQEVIFGRITGDLGTYQFNFGFPNVSQFHKILSHNSFDKFSVNSYTEFFILDISSVLLVVNETCAKTLSITKTI